MRRPSANENKTTWIILGTSIAGFLIFTAFTLYSLQRTVIHAEVARLEAVADAHRSEIDLLLRSYRERARLVASRTKLRHLIAEERRKPAIENRTFMLRIMRDAQNSDSSIVGITVIDPAGSIIATTDPALIGLSPADAAEQLEIMPQTMEIESVKPLIDDSEINLAVFSPVHLGGDFIGSMYVRFLASELASGLQESNFGESGEIFLGVRDKDGNARFVSGARKRSGAVATKVANAGDHRVPMIRALHGEDIVLTDDAVDYEGRNVLAVTRYLPALGWGLVAKIDEDEVKTRLSSNMAALALFGGLLLAISLIIGIYFNRRLVREQADRRSAQASLRAANEELQRALHDDLTGLAGRCLLLHIWRAAVARARRADASLGVLMIDLDGFKSVNDRFGHTAGDKVLVAVADRLKNCVRSSDCAARLGGDEFVVLLESLKEPARAKTIAQTITDAIQKPIDIGGQWVTIGASAGIAVSDSGSEEAWEDVFARADSDMYMQKKQSRRIPVVCSENAPRGSQQPPPVRSPVGSPHSRIRRRRRLKTLLTSLRLKSAN